MPAKRKGKAVLVTTAHRGVFFGYLVGQPSKEKTRLRECRNCIYWDAGIKGFVGLATEGPGDKCRIGPPAPEATLYDVTSVITVSDAAAKRWEDAPWGR